MQNYFDNEATSSALHATMKPARGGKCLATLSTYEDRKEALLNTTIMDDAGTYRSKGQKLSSTQQTGPQQNDAVDSEEAEQNTPSLIPKPPPPLQMTGISDGAYKNNNNHTQTAAAAAVATTKSSKQFALSDQRLSNGSYHNLQANLYNSSNNEAYNRSNKISASSNGTNTNRQTLRLGSVTIGEYRQQTALREPEKFDFISTQKKARDAGDTTPTNEALQSELQNTLSRSNLRKINGNSFTEHQRNCPLHQQQQQLQHYGNNDYALEEMSKKLQKSTLNENKTTTEQLLATTSNRTAPNANGSIGVGILKNGNRNGTSSSSKSIEKSIKFS